MIIHESNITTISAHTTVAISIPIDDIGTGCEYFLPSGKWSSTSNPIDENNNVGYNLIYDEPLPNQVRAEIYNDGVTGMVITVTNNKNYDIEVKIFLTEFTEIS